MIETQDSGSKWQPISAKIKKNPELRNFFGLSLLEPFCPHTLFFYLVKCGSIALDKIELTYNDTSN